MYLCSTGKAMATKGRRKSASGRAPHTTSSSTKTNGCLAMLGKHRAPTSDDSFFEVRSPLKKLRLAASREGYPTQLFDLDDIENTMPTEFGYLPAEGLAEDSHEWSRLLSISAVVEQKRNLAKQQRREISRGDSRRSLPDVEEEEAEEEMDASLPDHVYDDTALITEQPVVAKETTAPSQGSEVTAASQSEPQEDVAVEEDDEERDTFNITAFHIPEAQNNAPEITEDTSIRAHPVTKTVFAVPEEPQSRLDQWDSAYRSASTLGLGFEDPSSATAAGFDSGVCGSMMMTSGSVSMSRKEGVRVHVLPRSKSALPRAVVTRGQLRLSISVTNQKTLTVHVMEASGLASRWSEVCRPYVQTVLVPDQDGRSTCKTQVSAPSNNPKMDEKITYELLPEDEQKRLMVSAWNQDNTKKCGEFLGCMSFGIQHLMNKNKKQEVPLDDWYYLLSDNLGHRKHLVAHRPDKENQAPAGQVAGSPSASLMNPAELESTLHECGVHGGEATVGCRLHSGRAEAHSCRTHKVVVPRSATGYGFTIKGSAPVRVGRVKLSGTAERAGLRQGDCILHINGQEAREARTETIAKIVREATKNVVLQICRPVTPGAATSSSQLSQNSRGTASASCKSSKTSPSSVSSGSSRGSKRSPSRRSDKSGKSRRSAASAPDGKSTENVYATVKDEVAISSDDVIQMPGMTPAEKICMWGANLSANVLGDMSSQLPWQPDLSVIREERSTDLTSRLLHSEKRLYAGQQSLSLADTTALNANLSEIPRLETSARFVNSTLRNASARSGSSSGYPRPQEPLEAIYEEIDSVTSSTRPSSWHPVTPETSRQDDTTMDGRQGSFFSEVEASMPSRAHCQLPWTHPVAMMTESDSRRQGPYSDESSTTSERLVPSFASDSLESEVPDSLVMEDDRQMAIQTLLTGEEEFARQMKRGIQRFSRPLRHQILSPSQHKVLFQNVEKLVVLSEYHIRNMIEKSYCAENSYITYTDDVIVNVVGSVYKPKIRMLCEAYETYCNGLQEAVYLLEALRPNAEFNRFQQRAERGHPRDMSLLEFLARPVLHFEQLITQLYAVLYCTGARHEDFQDLQQVCHVVGRMSEQTQNATQASHSSAGPGVLTPGVTTPGVGRQGPRSTSTPSLFSSRFARGRSGASMSSSRRSSGSSRSSSSASNRSGSSIDSEVLDLQERLSFASDVTPCQIAAASRHVIFAGDLVQVDAAGGAPRWVTLCSDLLLVTEKQAEGHLKVTEEPILLQNIVSSDFHCVHQNEFCLGVRRGSSLYEIKLQTPSQEQKWAWKTILEQRLKSLRC